MSEDITDEQWILISRPHRKKMAYLLSKGVFTTYGANIILSVSPDGKQTKLRFERTEPDIFIDLTN